MLDRNKVITSLEEKKNDFISIESKCSDDLLLLKSNYEGLSKYSHDEIIANLNALGDTSGALPTFELDSNQYGVKFNQTFANHTEARQWAYQTLLDKITFAVDGSQILPSKDFTPPIAAIQVSKFENFHSKEGLYTKDIEFEVISSKELSNEELIQQGFTSSFEQYSDQQSQRTPRPISRDHYVNFRRFELEVDTLIEYIKTSHENNLKPVVFFDGSLIVTFITAEGATSGNVLYISYINKACDLLDIAEEYKIPVIGYIDSSGAHDLVDMIKKYFGISTKEQANINDTQLVNSYLEWGDRTPVFICDRPGVLKQYKSHKDKIGFTYLKTNKSLPSRLEFPMWMFEDTELFNNVIDIVRSEIIIGNGYIYSIESADASAVITVKDRQQFYKIFNEFAIKNKLRLNVAQKSMSKAKRRT